MKNMGHKGPKTRLPPWSLRTVAILLGAAGLLLFIAGSLGWLQTGRRQHRLETLNQGLAALFRDTDEKIDSRKLHDLAEGAGTLGLDLPEADYAVLYQQWLQAIGQFDQVSAALDNRYLKPRADELLKALHDDLLALRDAAGRTLETGTGLTPDLSWRIHNLRGCVSVLLAYSVLYFEEDGRKAAKFLADALEDYKQAIRLVDQTSLSSSERALPRWNLELIVSVGEYRLAGIPEIPRADAAEIREQLQAFIPEIPGFSPGVPLETRVEK